MAKGCLVWYCLVGISVAPPPPPHPPPSQEFRPFEPPNVCLPASLFYDFTAGNPQVHYIANSGKTWGEHEIDYVYLIQADVDLDPNPNEVHISLDFFFLRVEVHTYGLHIAARQVLLCVFAVAGCFCCRWIFFSVPRVDVHSAA